VLLTKQLKLVFTLSDGLDAEVKSIAGVLPGIYSAVYLSTGLPTPEAAAQSLTTAVRFDIAAQGSERKAQIFLLGLCHPEYGTVYTNQLELTLTMNDGSVVDVVIDLTKDLSDILSQYRGVLPTESFVDIRLEKISVGGTGGGVMGSVTQWTAEGNEIVTVN
jgi:hypothetical protein